MIPFLCGEGIMPDISAIASALSSLKAAKDIAEAMITLRDGAAFQSKLIEFQGKLIDANNAAFAAQDERAALLERIRDLEKQVTDLKAWEAEKEQYELKEVCDGVSFAYVLKPEAQGTKPPHWLCANCYNNNKKSILQIGEKKMDPAGRLPGWDCPSCKATIFVRYDIRPGKGPSF
jgi:hypothetical protein